MADAELDSQLFIDLVLCAFSIFVLPENVQISALAVDIHPRMIHPTRP
jgi:hypothetical protein